MKPSALLPVDVWLDDFARQIEQLRAGIEPEAVHRLRVCAGRLSVWLELGARRALRDDLRDLRRAAAAVRDLDVLAARAPAGAWAALLREQRASAATDLGAVVRTAWVDDLLGALCVVPDPDPVCVRAVLQHLRRRVLEAGDRTTDAKDPDRELHRLRRRVRRLRYAIEWLGADTGELRALQESLGELNNLAVEGAHLRAHAGHPASNGRLPELEREADRRREQAREAWRAVRPSIRQL